MDQIIFHLPKELKKEFKIKAIQEDKDMRKILVELVEKYLKGE